MFKVNIWFDKLVLESNHVLNVIAIIVQMWVKIWVQCQLSTNADLSHCHWLCWIMSWNWYIWIRYHPVKSMLDLGIDGWWYLAQCVQSPPKRWLSHDWAYYPGGPGRVSQTKPGSSYLPKPRLMFRPAQSVFNMLRVYLSHSIVIRKEPHKLLLKFISGQVTLLKDKANYLPHPSGFYHVQNSGSTTSIPLVDSYKVGLCKLPKVQWNPHRVWTWSRSPGCLKPPAGWLHVEAQEEKTYSWLG